MPTYREVISEVKLSAGFTPKTCWIAHVRELLGMRVRRAPNRFNLEERRHPCPPEKVFAIIAALHKFGRVQAAETQTQGGL